MGIGNWLDDGPAARGCSGRDTYFGFDRVSRDEKTRRVQRHFEGVAARYDLMNTLLSFGIHHLWKRTAVAALGLRSGETVLDVCGGTGDLTVRALRAVGPGGRVVLYDINRAMMQAGRRRVRAARNGARVAYVQGDARAISFPEGRFDAVMVGFGIRNVAGMRRGLAEMHRVLRPGGRLLCLEFSKPQSPLFRILYDLYSFGAMPLAGRILADNPEAYRHLSESIRTFPRPASLAAMLAQVGFEQVRYRRLTDGIACIHLGVKLQRSDGRHRAQA